MGRQWWSTAGRPSGARRGTWLRFEATRRACGWVEVATAVGDAEAGVTVRNSGDHIPAAQVDRLFEPFQRLASHRAAGLTSTGLGLAIVRSIVHAHHGTITAAPNAGGGLTVTATLPAK